MSSVVDIQLSYTHPCNSNDLLENSNWLGIHTLCMTLYCITHSIIDNTELQPPIAVPLHHFMCNLSIESLVILYFVQYCFDKINTMKKYFENIHGIKLVLFMFMFITCIIFYISIITLNKSLLPLMIMKSCQGDLPWGLKW